MLNSKEESINTHRDAFLHKFGSCFANNIQPHFYGFRLFPKEGDVFLEENKKKEGVVTLDSGLQYKIIKEGEGEKPSKDDTVSVHYKGTLVDGTKFDSSYDRGQPAEFKVGGVIPGWTEALQLMTVGSKWQLCIPSDLAYGERQAGPVIGPNSTLIFEVELLEIK